MLRRKLSVRLGMAFLATAAFAIAPGAMGDVVIDLFNFPDSGPGDVEANTANSPQSLSQSASDILGGERDLYVSTTNTNTTVGISVTVGGLAVEDSQTDSTFLSSVATITWDGTDGSTSLGDLNGDLSPSTEDGFWMITHPNSASPGLADLTVWWDGGSESSTVEDWDLSGGGGHYLAFSEFAAGVDWNDIYGIELSFLRDNMLLDAFGTIAAGPGPQDPDLVVPVPAAAGMGLLGMALVGLIRRKRS